MPTPEPLTFYTKDGADDTFVTSAEIARGEPNGVAPLDGTSVVPDANLPARLSASALNAAFAGLLGVAATVSADGALVLGKHNPVDASGGNRAMTLANPTVQNQLTIVEKSDSSTNTVTISGKFRGSTGTRTLVWQSETLLLVSDNAGSWWPIAGHKTKASLDSTYARNSKIVPSAALYPRGDSRMAGSTTSTGGSSLGISDMQTLIAAGLGLPVSSVNPLGVNIATSGSALTTAASTGGDWADRLQFDVRGTTFEPPGGVAVDLVGLNDGASVLGHTYAALAPFKAAMRAVVSRFLSGAVFEDNDPTMSSTGTWSTISGTGRNSGTTYAYSNTAGDTRVWTPPANFPGGTVSAELPAYGDGGSCVWTTTVNGITYTLDTSTYALTGNNPTTGVLRIPNVKRNNGPITFTVASVSATGAARAMFDSVTWEPAGDSQGLYVIIGEPKPLDYTSQNTAPFGPVTDAGIDALNQIKQEVAAEFGARVLFVDTSYIDKNINGTFWEAGNVHPNAAGHAYIAAQVLAAIKSAATIIPVPAKVPTGLKVSPTAFTSAVDGGTTVSNGTVTASYTNLSNGDRRVTITYAVGSSDTVGATRFALPSNELTGSVLRNMNCYAFRSGDGYYPLWAQLGTATGKVQTRLLPKPIRGAYVTTTNSSAAITAPAGTFSQEDVGARIAGTGIPSGTTIASVSSDTAATLSAAATAAGTMSAALSYKAASPTSTKPIPWAAGDVLYAEFDYTPA